MVQRKKPGRKPSDRIRQHVMLDPENRQYVKAAAKAEGRNFSDQVNWIIRERRFNLMGNEMNRAREGSAS